MDPEVADILIALPPRSMVIAFCLLTSQRQADVFTFLPPDQQDQFLSELNGEQLAELFNTMDPDDRAEVFEDMPSRLAKKMLGLMGPEAREQTTMMLAYPPSSVGRIMTPDFLTVRPDWIARAALDHVRQYGRAAETIETLYVTDDKGHLLDDLRLSNLLIVDPNTPIRNLMDSKFVSLLVTDDREKAVQSMQRYDKPAIPVVNLDGRIMGIVTFDDVADVAQEETTEDIQKMGGMEALDEPYMSTTLLNLFQKRGKWLVLLFLGEMLTASVMTHYSDVIHASRVLPLFLPLIISSGGNSGSQASTLIIRAMALGELKLHDWWSVLRRELACGLLLGLLLGVIGLIRIHVWQWLGWADYTKHYHLVATTVGAALVGVVVWGSVVGAMLPLILRRMGVDPATLSAPLVATLVDVTGLTIYFSIALAILHGTLP